MQQLPADALSRFVELYGRLEAERSWYEDASSLRFAAVATLTCAGTPAEVAAGIRARDQELKDALGWFSSMSAQLRMVVAALLHVHDYRPRAFLDEVERVRAFFRAAGLSRNRTYELMAILILGTRNGGQPIEQASVRRLEAIWRQMQTHHYWLTGADDYPACAILVHQPGSPEALGRRTEDIYQALRRGGHGLGNPLQTAANVLSLADETPAILARRFSDLWQGFRQAGLHMVRDDHEELAILSFLDHPPERIVDRVLRHRETIAALRPRPDRQLSFNLASSTAFLDLVRLDRNLKEVTDAKAMLDIQAIVQAQQAAAGAAAAGAATAAAAGGS